MARASYLGSARAMALAPATGRILRRRVAGFVSAVDINGQLEKMNSSLDQLEREADEFSGVNAGLIAIGCALGYLDFRFPDPGWRDGRPALAGWFQTFSERPSMVTTSPS